MAKINTTNYQPVTAWNGTQDLFVVEQPDGTKVATPEQVKQYVEAGDFEATGEIIDGHGNILAKKADITTVIIPAFTPSQAGWRRICKIKPYDMQIPEGMHTAEGVIYVGGHWSNGQPPSASIAVNIMNTFASLTLLSSAIGNTDDIRITDMRLVRASGAQYWLDVYFPAYSLNTGYFKLTFTGDIAVSDIQDPISITTDATAATDEISLNQKVNGTVLTDKSDVIAELTAITPAGINISAYNSASNQYTAPTDGYVRMELRNANHYFYLYVNGFTALGGEGHQVINANDYMTVFVRKGMKLYYTGTVYNATFFSLT